MKLTKIIELYGVDNVKFTVPMRPIERILGIGFKSSSTPEQQVECVVDESRYRVEDGYKITLRAVDDRYGYEHFYISDFESLMRGCPDHYKYEVTGLPYDIH